ncbi:MAG: rhodanese-like domain-containing protein [Sphaerochaetaceae bacterium]|nr:rhodanese-like domain-containing protein [Sphaerochaetaceae bacterium]
MKRWFIAGLLVVSIVLLVSCAAKQQQIAEKPEYRKISAAQAKEMIDTKAYDVIIDVRTAQEFAQGHIPNAVLIPNETITTSRRPEELPDLHAVLLVYCRSGNRSAQAAKKLVALGYTKVYDFGGIGDWPYEVTR